MVRTPRKHNVLRNVPTYGGCAPGCTDTDDSAGYCVSRRDGNAKTSCQEERDRTADNSPTELHRASNHHCRHRAQQPRLQERLGTS